MNKFYDYDFPHYLHFITRDKVFQFELRIQVVINIEIYDYERIPIPQRH